MLVIPATHEGKPVKEIAARAFSDEWKLKELVLPDSVTTIGESAFSCCYSLARITLGKGLTALDEYCFNTCPVVEVYNRSALPLTVGGEGYLQYNAKHIYGEGGESRITHENGYMIYTDGATKRLLGYLGTETKLTLPDGLTEIGKYALALERFTEITLPDSVTEIGMDAFSSCQSLASVRLGSGLGRLGDRVFADCTRLAEITIPASVKTIYENAFSGCSSLTRVTFEKTEGWTVGGAPFDGATLADPETAAAALHDNSHRIWSNKT